jgi:hypothetical protein
MAARFDAAAAIGAPPIAGTGSLTNPYTEVAGLMPTFPSTDHLTRSSFIVTVSSDRAQVPTRSAPLITSDFVTNVSLYAPRTTPVTRVQLVDIDIPCTQRLIEEPWHNLFFGQGVYTAKDVRALNVTIEGAGLASVVGGDAGVGGGGGGGGTESHQMLDNGPCGSCIPGPGATSERTVSAVLPLLLDKVRTYSKLSTTNCTLRVVMENRAPYPMHPIARAWRAMGPGLKLVGPTIGGLVLNAEQVYDDTPFSFVVQVPRSVYNNIGAAGTDVMYLYAAPIPGPDFLAAVASKALGVVMATVCPVPWPHFAFEYDPIADRFSLYARAPHGLGMDPVPITLTGGVFGYMGFGSSFRVEVPTRRAVTLPATATRLAALGRPLCFAEVQCGSPPTPGVFAAWIQTAMNTYTWPQGMGFTVTVPGAVPPATTVALPSGQGTLEAICDRLNATVLGSLGLQASVVPAGIEFRSLSSPGTLFGLDFTGLPAGYAARIGYDPIVLSPATRHSPTLPRATHIPVLDVLCGPPRSGFQVQYRSLDTDQLVVRTTPFEPLVNGVTVTIRLDGTVAVSVLDPTVMHGLQPGAAVLLVNQVADPHIQVTAYVTHVPDVTGFEAVLEGNPGLDPMAWSATASTLIPLDTPPLDLYFGASVRVYHALLPDMCGFRARAYEDPRGSICSPNTVCIQQDPFVVICLGFDGTEAEPLTGDVYYPEQNCPLVFAKVPRTSLFKSDFFKVYDHTFEGAGRTLGFVRVRILNPNGTLYQTHGHTVMVTLLFNTRQSMVGFGAGKVSVTYAGDGPPPGMPDFGGRQVVPIAGGRGGVSARV